VIQKALPIFAAMTNYKNALIQICSMLERMEFAIGVALYMARLEPATVRALKGQPEEDGGDAAAAESGEFYLTGAVAGPFTEEHPLFARMRAKWASVVQDIYATLSECDEDAWPPVGFSAELANEALSFNPSFVKEFLGLKINRPDVCCTTLQISESFHGRQRQDSVLLNAADDAYDDVRSSEFALLHCFFSYSGVAFMDLLKHGAQQGGKPPSAITPFSQFSMMQRYISTATSVAAFPLRYYTAKMLSKNYELCSISVIRSRARPLPWFCANQDNDMNKMRGAIFCQFN
jgi:hypothetical protein